MEVFWGPTPSPFSMAVSDSRITQHVIPEPVPFWSHRQVFQIVVVKFMITLTIRVSHAFHRCVGFEPFFFWVLSPFQKCIGTHGTLPTFPIILFGQCSFSLCPNWHLILPFTSSYSPQLGKSTLGEIICYPSAFSISTLAMVTIDQIQLTTSFIPCPYPTPL